LSEVGGILLSVVGFWFPSAHPTPHYLTAQGCAQLGIPQEERGELAAEGRAPSEKFIQFPDLSRDQ